MEAHTATLQMSFSYFLLIFKKLFFWGKFLDLRLALNFLATDSSFQVLWLQTLWHTKFCLFCFCSFNFYTYLFIHLWVWGRQGREHRNTSVSLWVCIDHRTPLGCRFSPSTITHWVILLLFSWDFGDKVLPYSPGLPGIHSSAVSEITSLCTVIPHFLLLILSFLIYSFWFCVYECFADMHGYAQCVCAWCSRRPGVRCPETRIRDDCGPCGCWRLNTCPLQGQEIIFTAKLSLKILEKTTDFYHCIVKTALDSM